MLLRWSTAMRITGRHSVINLTIYFFNAFILLSFFVRGRFFVFLVWTRSGSTIILRSSPVFPGSQTYVVYLGWPIAPSYVSPNAEEGREVVCMVLSANECSCALGAQVNFQDLTPTPYLTYGFPHRCCSAKNFGTFSGTVWINPCWITWKKKIQCHLQ